MLPDPKLVVKILVKVARKPHSVLSDNSPVHVLLHIHSLRDGLLVQMIRQRQLDNDTVYRVVIIEFLNNR